jgi:hypothetical protein
MQSTDNAFEQSASSMLAVVVLLALALASLIVARVPVEVTAWVAHISAALESSSIGHAVRATPSLYPVLESLHILGIAILVGSALAVDLRLLGVARTVLPVTTVMRYLLPLSHIGFLLVALTGTAMITAVAVSVSSSPAAPWKLGLILVAGANILVFHTGVYRSVQRWDLNARTPLRAQIAAIVSAFTWMGVIIAGRFLAY